MTKLVRWLPLIVDVHIDLPRPSCLIACLRILKPVFTVYSARFYVYCTSSHELACYKDYTSANPQPSVLSIGLATPPRLNCRTRETVSSGRLNLRSSIQRLDSFATAIGHRETYFRRDWDLRKQDTATLVVCASHRHSALV